MGAASVSDRLTAIDLFAGVGGLSLGLEQAGFDVLAVAEWDPVHAAAHRFNFPNTETISDDIAEVSGGDLLGAAKRGAEAHGRDVPSQIDLIAGGPPCQGFSVGGLMDPNDPRNLLVQEFVRLVKTVRPRAFLMENVPAIASRVHKPSEQPVIRWLTESLEEAGYTVAAPIRVNASWYGVPQDRRRLFVAGSLDPDFALSTPKPLVQWRARRAGIKPRPGPSLSAEALTKGPSAGEAIADLPNLDDFVKLLVSDRVTLTEKQLAVQEKRASSYANVLAGRTKDPGDLSYPRAWDSAVLTSSLRTTHSNEVSRRFGKVEPGDVDSVSRFERIDPDGLCPTLRAGSAPDRGSFSAPRPIHPEWNRVISVREAARLHGFPDWFQFTIAKWHGFRQVGNSVCPPVARAFAADIAKSLANTCANAPTKPVELGGESLLRVTGARGQRKRSVNANNQAA